MLPLLPLGSAALGILQAGVGLYNLHKLNKQKYPYYSVSPEMENSYNRAESRAGQGFTEEQEADFRQGLSASNNTARINAINQAGGNLAGGINAALGAQKVGALNQFAADDAAQQLSNIHYADSIASQIQAQRNLATQQRANQMDMARQQFGMAAQSGLNNIFGLGNALAASDQFRNWAMPDNSNTSLPQQPQTFINNNVPVNQNPINTQMQSPYRNFNPYEMSPSPYDVNLPSPQTTTIPQNNTSPFNGIPNNQWDIPYNSPFQVQQPFQYRVR